MRKVWRGNLPVSRHSASTGTGAHRVALAAVILFGGFGASSLLAADVDVLTFTLNNRTAAAQNLTGTAQVAIAGTDDGDFALDLFLDDGNGTFDVGDTQLLADVPLDDPTPDFTQTAGRAFPFTIPSATANGLAFDNGGVLFIVSRRTGGDVTGENAANDASAALTVRATITVTGASLASGTRTISYTIASPTDNPISAITIRLLRGATELSASLAFTDSVGAFSDLGANTLNLTDFVTVLNALADGNRIENGQTLELQVVPSDSSEIDPGSTLSTGTLAQTVSASATVTSDGTTGALQNLTVSITSPANINSYELFLRRGGADIGVALPGLTLPVTPGVNTAVDVSTAVLTRLNSLADGTRVENGQVFDLRVAPQGVLGGTLDTNNVAAVVQFTSTAVSSAATGALQNLTFTLVAPADINTYSVFVRRAAADIGVALPGLTLPVSPGAANIDVSTAVRTRLDALADTTRVENNQVFDLRIAPQGAAGGTLDTNDVNAVVNLSITNVATNATSNTVDVGVTYQVSAPARVDSFTARVGADMDTGAPGLEPGAPIAPLTLAITLNADLNPGTSTYQFTLDATYLNGIGDLPLVTTIDLTENDASETVAETQEITDNFQAFDLGIEVALQSISLNPAQSDATVVYNVAGAFANDFCVALELEPVGNAATVFLREPVTSFVGRSVGNGKTLTITSLAPLIRDALLSSGSLPNASGVQQDDVINARLRDFIDGECQNTGNSVQFDPAASVRSITARVDLQADVISFGLSNVGDCGPECFTLRYTITSPGPVPAFTVAAGIDRNGNQRLDVLDGTVYSRVISETDLRMPGTHDVNIRITTPLGEVQNSDVLRAEVDTTNAVREDPPLELESPTGNNRLPADGNPLETDLSARSLLVRQDPNFVDADPRAGQAVGRVEYEVTTPGNVAPFEIHVFLQGTTNTLLRAFRVENDTITRLDTGAAIPQTTGDFLERGVHAIDNLPLGDALANAGASSARGSEGECADVSLAIFARIDATDTVVESDPNDNDTAAAQFDYRTDLAVNGSSVRFVDPERPDVSVPEPDFDSSNAVFAVEFQYSVRFNDANQSFGVAIFAVGADGAEQPLTQGRFNTTTGQVEQIAGNTTIAIADPSGSGRINRLITGATARIPVFGPAPGTFANDLFTVRVRLDPDNAICEADESNNTGEAPAGDANLDIDRDGDGLTDFEERRGFFVSRYVSTVGGERCPNAPGDCPTDDCEVVGQPRADVTRFRCLVRTDPENRDTDGDGISDFDEIVTFALAADSSGRVPGAGRSGTEELEARTIRACSDSTRPCFAATGKFASGVRTDPTRTDSDCDGIGDSLDPAPQFNPAVFGFGPTASAVVERLDLCAADAQRLLLDFDQDGDGFLEAPDANGDGVPDLTRASEITLERIFGLDFSNDGSLDDGYDLGGKPSDSFLEGTGRTARQVAPPDDPATRPLTQQVRNQIGDVQLEPRFGSYRVGFVDPTGLASPPQAGFRFANLVPALIEFGAADGSGVRAPRLRRVGTSASLPQRTMRGNGRIDPTDDFEITNTDGLGARPFVLQTFPADNCPGDASDPATLALRFNPTQLDRDADGIGDTCDPDSDNDGVSDQFENSGACGCGTPMLIVTLVGFCLTRSGWRRFVVTR